MRILFASLAAVTVAGTALVAGGQASAAPAAATETTEYIVLAASDGATAGAAKAVKAAGGTVVESDASIGYVVARSSAANFSAKVSASADVLGAARNRVVGVAPKDVRAKSGDIETLRKQSGLGKGSTKPGKAQPGAEPLAGLQWDMKQIDATPKGSYAEQPGKKGVKIGIIDTGIDGTHPDIAPNFDAKESRNFVTDIPDIDGACEVSTCKDPANVDDDGHGTHVASTIGSPINGLGMAGVAPNVTLVNIRAGQDSGYFFLEATLKALVYAGDIGVDVVNMSYYTDPWLYNCVANPADTPAEQREQRVVRTATQRALNYARAHGVLPVSALGNEATDLNLPEPIVDDTSPDYPVDAAKERTIDNSCLNVPAESNGVVSVSATGQTTRKSYYSNYGTEETDVAAPGGDTYDTPGNTRDIKGAVLAAYPKSLAVLNEDVDPVTGAPTNEAVVRDCKGSVCGYYQYLQGTSMASPHAVGVAALIVSEYGKKGKGGDIGLAPAATQALLYSTATEHACPNPRTYTYTRNLPDGTTATASATCEGGVQKNGFYGHGIVNALAAVS